MMNVHYHGNLSCPHIQCLSFNPVEVEILEEVGAKLSPEHMARNDALAGGHAVINAVI